jgi:hypothetical protein
VVGRFFFAVPGDLATPTGGYGYDRRMIAELRGLGWEIDLIDLGEDFPSPSEPTRAAARTRLLALPAGRPIVIDGLALGVLPEAALQLAGRNPLLALVHHPLALEWGLSPAQADALRASERTALAAVQGVVVRLRCASRAYYRRKAGQRSNARGARESGRRRAAAVGRRCGTAQGF